MDGTYTAVPLQPGDPPAHGEAVAAAPGGGSRRLMPRGPAARAWRWVTRPCRELYHFFAELCAEFGWRFVAIVVLVYGFNQGFGEGYLSQGRLYYLKDVMRLQPTETTTVLAAAHIPWNMKTIYGSWSDALPIFGFHRTPYIAIAGLLGAVAWVTLWLSVAQSVFLATLMLFLINLSIASPDVIIDASVAERVAEKPRFGPALQSLCWGAFAVGGIASCLTAGWLNDARGPQFLFAVGTATALAILVPAVLNWLHEVPGATKFRPPAAATLGATGLPDSAAAVAAVAAAAAAPPPAAVAGSRRGGHHRAGARRKCRRASGSRGGRGGETGGTAGGLGVRLSEPVAATAVGPNRQCVRLNLDALREHWLLFVMAYVIAGCAVALGLAGFYLSTDGIMVVTVVVAFVVCCATYGLLAVAVPSKHLRGARSTVAQKLRHGGLIAKPVLFVFLNGCVQPTVSDTLFYWMTDDLCNASVGATHNATHATPGVDVAAVHDDQPHLPPPVAPCTDHGPMFDQVFISHMDCAAYAGFILGIVVYNKYLAAVTYRRIFLIASAALVGISLLDLAFVLRLNLRFGISDSVFAVGDNAVAPIARRFYSMPMLLLAAKLCPPGMEATLFASIMALSNFGGDVGAYFGIVLQRLLGVSRGHYENLWLVVLVKTCCKAIPALLVFCLVPDASPEDDLVDLDASVSDVSDSDDSDSDDDGGDEEQHPHRHRHHHHHHAPVHQPVFEVIEDDGRLDAH